jgi:polar amino acid transport system permease protein
MLEALAVTVAATGVASLIALGVGLVLALMWRSPVSAVSAATRAVIELVRNTPLLVQLYIVFYVLPEYGVTLTAFLTGTLVLGIHFACFTAEVYRAGIASLGRGQWDACIALNLPRARTWSRIVLPQAIVRVIPALGNYVVQMFKATPLLAFITVTELLSVAQTEAARSFRYLEPMTMVGVLFLVLSYPTAVAIRRLEDRYASVG